MVHIIIIMCFNYKESIFCKNSDYLKYLYNIHLLIKSITNETMNINNNYYSENKKDLLKKIEILIRYL